MRRIGFGPEFAGSVPGFLYCAYMPEANGCTFWEHANYRWEWMPRIKSFLQDDAYAKAIENAGRTARYIHRQFYEQCIHLSDTPNRTWMWAPDISFLACISYPQQGGRGYLADFANQLARGNPDYLCYSWCDSLLPMGFEPEHREIAAAYRSLPTGAYLESDRKDGVFLRRASRKDAFCVVNTNGEAVQTSLKTGVSGAWHDAVSGESLRCDGDATRFSLKAFECKVYLPGSK
ncbi:MAG: alpha amylase C-terminal domain-containing protein [Planctomycetota bacterium]|nr:alpha amylase C-terminal domain-containing protein [Planctomycetota bacterium]